MEEQGGRRPVGLPGRSGLPSGHLAPAGGGRGEGEGRLPSPVHHPQEPLPLREEGDACNRRERDEEKEIGRAHV